MIMIEICPSCESKYIRKTKNKYICNDCNRIFRHSTSKFRNLEDEDFIYLDNKTNQDIKDFVFNLLFKNKNRILNRKNINMRKWLDIYYIKYKENEKFISVEEIVKYLKNISDKCEICGKELKYIGLWKRGCFNHYCSDKCHNKAKSNRQKDDNSFYKIKDIEEWKNKVSVGIKNKIREGKYIPKITNSWANSMCVTNINGKEVKFRSTWEAFFNKVNEKLEYEKIIIPYQYKKVEHNYIVDFVDRENKKLYEIKPKSEINRGKNKIKFEYAFKWCQENNYEFIIIDDDWFYMNYDKNVNILDIEKDKKIIRNLKQFSNEGKKNK